MHSSLFWVMLFAALSSFCVRFVRADTQVCMFTDVTDCSGDRQSNCCEDVSEDDCCTGPNDGDLFMSCDAVDDTLIDEKVDIQAYGGNIDQECIETAALEKGECPSSDISQITGCALPKDTLRLFARGPRQARKTKRATITKLSFDGQTYTLPMNSSVYPAYKAAKDRVARRAIMIAHGTRD